MMNTGPKIAVVGGGIGGLTAALALLRRGFQVEVYEQAPELKEVGAGVQISANGTRVLFALGLEEPVRAASFEPQGKEIRLWNSGDTWKLFDLGAVSVERYGFPYLTIHRNDLHQALAAAIGAIKSDAIRLGARCIGLDQGVTGVRLRFSDGRTAGADLAVGADGVHSKVREALFGPGDPSFTGIVAWRGVIPMERLPVHLHRPIGTNWVGPGGHVIHYPLRRGELMNFVSVVEREDWQVESWSVAGTVDECLADYPGWHPDVHSLIRSVGKPYKWALMGRAPMDQWSVGRVTLLGDACHPMLPFLAQGAVMALEDGYVLARCFEAYGQDYATCFSRYEAARRERTAKVVNGSAANVDRFHNRQLADGATAESYIDAEWAEQRVKERYEWLFTYDATSVSL